MNHFQCKTEGLFAVLAFCLHINDENTYSQVRPLDLETKS